MNYKLLLGLWLCPVITSLAAPGVETVFQPVALAGLPAPGVTNNNVKFSFFEDVSLADDGRIAFTGLLTGPGVTSTNEQGLWAGLPGDLQLLARTGDPKPGSTNSDALTFFWNPNIDNHQAVAFVATHQTCTNCLLKGFGITVILGTVPTDGTVGIATEFPNLPSYNPIAALISRILGHIVNAGAARVQFFGPGIGPTNNLAIIAGPPTNAVIVAQTGSPAPGVAGNFTFFPNDSQAMALTQDGNVAFRAQATDGPAMLNGLWFGKAGTVQLVAFQNRPAPASLLGPGYTFGLMPNSAVVEVNARGELGFAANLNGPGLNSTNSSFVIVGPPGALRVIAQSGQAAPGIPGAVFADFGHVLLGTDGTAAFTARFTTNGTDLVSGLWLAPTNGAPPRLLMHAGQRAPGTPTDVYFKNSFAYEAYFMNARNQVVFRSGLSGPGLDQFDNGIWLAEPDGTVNLIVRTGDMVDTGNGVMAQLDVVTFGLDPEFSAGPEDGRRSPFNNRGEIALRFGFASPALPLKPEGGLFIAQTGIILRAKPNGNDIRVKFPTLTNHNYRVEYKTNLVGGAWSVLAPSVAGTGGEVVVTNTGVALSGSRYYQVVRTD